MAGILLGREEKQADPETVQELLTAIANDDANEMVDILEWVGPSVRFQFGSPLHAAATYGAEACTARLLLNGAAIDERDKDGHTALHLAAVGVGSAPLLRALLEARADLRAETQEFRAKLMNGGLKIDCPGGRTALHLAAADGNFDAVQALLAADPSLAQACDLDEATPWDVVLHEGAKSGQPQLASNRRRVAEALAPGKRIPEMADLRAAATAAAARRAARMDAAEAEAKAAEQIGQGAPREHGYRADDSELYNLSPEEALACLAPDLSAALALPEDSGARAAALRALAREITPGVFALRLFSGCGSAALEADSSHRCLGARLLQEVQAIEAWAVQTSWALKRPNSMNRYGVVLADIGLGAAVNALVDAAALPLASALWPERFSEAGQLTNRHAFTVRYRGGEDRKLDTHIDSSDLTVNICLGSDFVGGGVYFHDRATGQEAEPDPMTSPHPAVGCPRCRVTHGHEPGVALLHLGDHVHGAHNIEAGERTNLVVWCRRGKGTGDMDVD